MIYDIHTHFWNPEDVPLSFFEAAERAGVQTQLLTFTAEDHLRATEAVDRAVVFGMRAKGLRISNDVVCAQVCRAPDRLVFFTSVDPAEDGFMDELERTHHDLGARGIKLGPVYQGVHPADERYRRIYTYAQTHSLPVMIHMATTFTADFPLEYARPLHMDSIACEYPGLKIILAHLGHPWYGETAAVIRRHPNVYADISALYYRPWQFYTALMTLAEYGVWRKVFFGSDFPFTLPCDSIRGLMEVNRIVKYSKLPQVPDEVIRGILESDPFTALGIT